MPAGWGSRIQLFLFHAYVKYLSVWSCAAPSGTQVDHKKWTSFCTDTSLDKLSCSVFFGFFCCCCFCVLSLGGFISRKIPVFRKNTEGLPGEKQQESSAEEKLENTVACSCSAVTPWKRCMNQSEGHTVSAAISDVVNATKNETCQSTTKPVCVSWDELPDCLRCVPPWTAGG